MSKLLKRFLSSIKINLNVNLMPLHFRFRINWKSLNEFEIIDNKIDYSLIGFTYNLGVRVKSILRTKSNKEISLLSEDRKELFVSISSILLLSQQMDRKNDKFNESYKLFSFKRKSNIFWNFLWKSFLRSLSQSYDW